MPRFRSFSLNNSPSTPPASSTSPAAASSGPSSPALLSRGFRSIRRARRRSLSVPSSPASQQQQDQQQQQQHDCPPPPPSQLQTQPNAIMSSANSSSNSLPASDPPNRTQSRGSNNGSNGTNIRMVPNLGIGSRCFVFDIIERTIPPGVVFKIGRYSDRNIADDRLSFKSKVVSRNHAELWTEEDNKVYLRDVGSSSGTFVNRARLSPAGVPSAPQEIKDGDLVQLGVDYQGGIETMFRAVRMRVELNREPPTVSQPFSRAAFQQLRQHLITTVGPTPQEQQQPSRDEDAKDLRQGIENTATATTGQGSPLAPAAPPTGDQIQECCICLYAIAPLQALFISPCSHIFHFKCLRPLLFQNYPGFSCPICRSYSDLEASVAIEVRDLVEIMGENQDKEKHDHDQGDHTDDDDDDVHPSDIGGEELHPTTTNVEPEPSHEEEEEDNNNHHHHHGVPVPSSTTTTTTDHTTATNNNNNNNNNNSTRSTAAHVLSSAARGAAELSSTLVATPPNLDAVMSAGTSPL